MRMKIRTKIITSTALVVSISLMMSGFFIFDYAKKVMREQTINDSRTKLAQVSFQLKKIQEQVMKTAEYIVSNEEITTLVYQLPSGDIKTDYFRKQQVQDKMKRFVALNNFILNVLLVRPDGSTYSNYNGYEDYFAEYLKQDWFVKMKDSHNDYSEPHPFFYLGGNSQVFSYVLKFRPDGESSTPYSYLILDIDYSELHNLFVQSSQDFEQIELYTGSGARLFATRDHLPQADSSFVAAALAGRGTYREDTNRIVLINDSMNQGWKQAALISKARLFDKINRIFYFYIVIILSGILVTLAVMLPIIVNLTKPLSQLTNAMKRVASGDLGTRVTIRSGDELEILGFGFNRMVDDLKNLIETSIEGEKMKRKMQTDLLMAQINPHFVYNTLNTVIYLAHARRNSQAVEVTQALIGILQDLIKTGEGAVRAPLADEMRVMNKYVIIQQTRYPDRFRLIWDVDESLLDKPVPRMVLQPLVENAIVHGIIPTEQEKGEIVVRAYRVGNQICLEVADNGQGVAKAGGGPDARLDAEPERTRGIGLSNIRERLHTYFGISARLVIESDTGSGTTVRILFPMAESE